MKAILCTRYGEPEVLKMAEVPKPVPKDSQICVKIHATAVTASDIFIRSSDLPLRFKIPMRLYMGILKPRRSILGLVFAGVVDSIGKNVRRFKPGDPVYGLTGFRLGTYAEYTCIPEKDSTHGACSIKPANIGFEEATMVAYGGLLALQFLEKGNIKQGQQVLIYGASGTSGTFAVQIAKHWGAEVTGVCSGKNAEMVRNLGADHIIDYTKQDTVPEGTHYDFMLDAAGKMKSSPLKTACKNALSPLGKYASIDDGSLKLSSPRLDQIRDLVEAGIIKPVLDKIFTLEEIVEAHRYVEKGHKKGGVAVRVIY